MNNYRLSFIHYALLLPVLAALTVGTVSAQGGRGSDNVLYPQIVRPVWIGPEAGYGYWMSDGSYGVTDQSVPCTAFTKGNGGNAVFGVKMFLPIGDWVYIIPKVTYEGRKGAFTSSLPDDPVRDINNRVASLSQEAESKATFNTVNLDLRAALNIGSTGIYLSAGGSGGLIVGNAYDYSERILNPEQMRYTDTRTNEHTLLSNLKFSNVQSYVLDMRAGIGYLWKIKRLAFNPELSLSYPLTSTLKAPDSMKQMGFILTVGVLYDIHPDY